MHEALDAVLGAMSTATEAEVWRLARLTPREKVLLSVVADVCQSTLGSPFEQHLALARRHDVSIEDVREAIRFVSYDSGYHVAAAAMQKLNELVPAQASDARPIVEAAQGTENPLPPFARQWLDDLGQGFSSLMALQSRMRKDHLTSLSVRERAFLTLTIDVLYQTLGDTFRIHARRAMAVGVDHETLREVVCFSAQFGAARAWSGLRELNRVFAEADAS